jgi:hypothetical protein
LSEWQKEFNMFSTEALEDMKTYSDNTHEEREWMCYVYAKDGQYHLGEPSFGSESRIEVNPTTKAAQDAVKNGLTDRKWTIHSHPLKDGKIYTGRQYFSSTDICGEFINCRDNDERVVQFLVYPHQQLDTKTGRKVIHNRVRTLVFPDRQGLIEAMSRSNPGVDVMAITRETGQNTNAADGSLVNQAGVDWFALQDALGNMGYMGIVDLEGPSSGAVAFKSENLLFRNLASAGLITAGLVGLVWWNSQRSEGTFGAEVEVIDDRDKFWKY